MVEGQGSHSGWLCGNISLGYSLNILDMIWQATVNSLF